MSTQVVSRRERAVIRRKASIVGDVIGAFESDTAAVLLRTAPRHERVIVYGLLGIIVFAITFCSIVKLDMVVTGPGVISPVKGLIYVAPFDTGIVKQLNVKVGDVVKKGQALALLDPTFTQADLLQAQQHLASDLAQIAREEAELARQPYAFSNTDPAQRIQGEIWLKRQAQYHADLAKFDGEIQSAEAQMSQAKSDVDKYSRRLKLATDVEDVYKPLLEKGYVSKLQLMQASDTRTEMSRLMADAENQIAQYRETTASLKAQRESYIQQWYSATSTQLVADRNDRDSTQQALDKAQKLRDLVSLDAPEDAVVVGVAKVSKGAVATGGGMTLNIPGQDPLFTLMPLNAPLQAIVHVAAQDVGFVKLGQKATIKLDAYVFMRYGTAEGVVKTISGGSYTLDENNQPVLPYFKVNVEITGLHLRNVPKDVRILPGNTVVGDVLVGKRTIMSYLVEGAFKTGSEAFREP